MLTAPLLLFCWLIAAALRQWRVGARHGGAVGERAQGIGAPAGGQCLWVAVNGGGLQCRQGQPDRAARRGAGRHDWAVAVAALPHLHLTQCEMPSGATVVLASALMS